MILVFLERCEFYQKIVLFSFFRFMEEPSDDVLYSFCTHLMLLRHLLSCIVRRQTLVASDEVIIDDGLVAEFDLMPLLRHTKVIRVPHQIRNIVQWIIAHNQRNIRLVSRLVREWTDVPPRLDRRSFGEFFVIVGHNGSLEFGSRFDGRRVLLIEADDAVTNLGAHGDSLL